MKKLLLVITGLAAALAFFVPVNVNAAAKKSAKPAYDFEFVNQEPQGMITMQPGETKTVWIEVKNTGTKTWFSTGNPTLDAELVRDQGAAIVSLGTGSKYDIQGRGHDYSSAFFNEHNYWLAPNRASLMSNGVTMLPFIQPGWNTRFQINLKAPERPGVYKEYFTPVAENITWMKDIGIYWDIRVVAPDGHIPAEVYFWPSNSSSGYANIHVGDSIYVGADTASPGFLTTEVDSNVLQYIGRKMICNAYKQSIIGYDQIADIDICNKTAKKAVYAFRAISNGVSRVGIDGFSGEYINVGGGTTSEYNFSNDQFINFPRDTTEFSAKSGEVVNVTMPSPGDGGYIFDEPEFPAGRIKLLSHEHFAATSGLIGDFGSDQWAFQILDSNPSNYIQIRATRPWSGGDSITEFLLSINPIPSCSSTANGCMTPAN